MRRSSRATEGWRDRPDPRNCPRWLRGSTRTETDREDSLIEMDGENFRPPQKMEGQLATGTTDHVPTLVDPHHDRREGAPLRPGMANCDYTKCTPRLDGVYISKRTRLVVTAPLGDVAIEEESSPPPPSPRKRHARSRWRSGADTPNRNHRQRTVRDRPPRPVPPRFQGRMYLKRERTVSGNQFV